MRCFYFKCILNCSDLDYISNEGDIIMGCQLVPQAQIMLQYFHINRLMPHNKNWKDS